MTARTVYSIPALDEHGEGFFPYLEAAKSAALAAAEASGNAREVYRHAVSADLKDRDLLVALLEGRGWASNTELVFTARPNGQAK